MARTGENQNITRQAEFDTSAQQDQAFKRGQGEISQFDQNQATLNRGGQVAANPWESARYLSNVNRLQSGALNSEENAGDAKLQQVNRRTGGTNTGATIGAQKELSLDKMRLGTQLSSERAAGDFNKNVAFQQHQAEAPLEGAHAEAPYYGSAVAGTVGLNKELTAYGLQSQAYTYKMYDLAMKAAQAAASAGVNAATGGAGVGGFGEG